MYRQCLYQYSTLRSRIFSFKAPYIGVSGVVPRYASLPWRESKIANCGDKRFISSSIRHWNEKKNNTSSTDKSHGIMNPADSSKGGPKPSTASQKQKKANEAEDSTIQDKEPTDSVSNQATLTGYNPLSEKKSNSNSTDSKTIDPVQTSTGEILEEEDDGYLTTIFDGMEPYLDTYEVYTQLINAGFSDKQANSIMNLIIIQINTKVSKLSTKFAQIYELENERYLFESAQQELRVDSTRSREQHINELIALTHILERDFLVISDELNNEVLQMKNDTQVAINDQKLENTLHSKQIYLRIQETNHKISTELISLMRSEIETLRWNISRWGIMAILACVFVGFVTFYVYKAKSSRRERAEGSEFVPLVIHEPSELEEDDYHTDLDRSEVA